MGYNFFPWKVCAYKKEVVAQFFLFCSSLDQVSNIVSNHADDSFKNVK